MPAAPNPPCSNAPCLLSQIPHVQNECSVTAVRNAKSFKRGRTGGRIDLSQTASCRILCHSFDRNCAGLAGSNPVWHRVDHFFHGRQIPAFINMMLRIFSIAPACTNSNGQVDTPVLGLPFISPLRVPCDKTRTRVRTLPPHSL